MRASHARTREGTALSSNRWAPHTHRSEAVLVPHVHLGAFAEEGLDRDRVAVAAREVQRGDVVGGLGRHLARHAGALLVGDPAMRRCLDRCKTFSRWSRCRNDATN